MAIEYLKQSLDIKTRNKNDHQIRAQVEKILSNIQTGGDQVVRELSEQFDNYLGTMIAGFPNLFMIHGVGSPGVLYTMPLGGERTTQWIGQCISHLNENNLGALEATDEAAKAWNEEINTMANQTLYPQTNSWYVGANVPGKPRQFLAHLRGSQFFDRLFGVADSGYEGFEFEDKRAG